MSEQARADQLARLSLVLHVLAQVISVLAAVDFLTEGAITGEIRQRIRAGWRRRELERAGEHHVYGVSREAERILESAEAARIREELEARGEST